MGFLQNFPDQTLCLCHNEHLAVTTSVCSKRKVIAQTIIRMAGNISGTFQDGYARRKHSVLLTKNFMLKGNVFAFDTHL